MECNDNSRPTGDPRTMKYICLGYIDEKQWEAMSEGEGNAIMDEIVAYDDVLRMNGHLVARKRSKGLPARLR